MKLIIEIDEDVRIAIEQMGLLRIPDEMQKKVDKAIQHGTPIEQEPKTGEWQQDLDGTYLCSECGSGFKEQPTFMGKPMFLWCPLCGCRMESEDNE